MEGQAIAADVPCVGCGYNLRTQPVEGVCTECGLAVRESLEQTILKWGSARLRRIARGMRLQAATTIAILLILPAGIVLTMWFDLHGGSGEAVGTITLAMMTVASVMHVVGAWNATGAPTGERHVLSRWLCRLGGLMIPLVMFGLTIQNGLQSHTRAAAGLIGLIMSLLLATSAIYGERAAVCWAAFHRRGGFGSKEGMGKWAMRGYALAMFLMAACMSANFATQALEELDIVSMGLMLEERVFAVTQPLLLGSLIAMGILLILIIVALFRGANRASELARLATEAERRGFTAPLAAANGAPSCS